MKIVVANKNQLSIVANLAYAIWPIAYGEILSKEQLDYMLDKFYSVDSLNDQLVNKKHVFLLVEESNTFIGFASYELNSGNSTKTKIHKIYVLPNTQGKGIGQVLILEIEKKAIESNNKFLFLNVNRNNKALGFYLKNNFEIVNTEDIEIGNGYLMEDYIMEKEIKPPKK